MSQLLNVEYFLTAAAAAAAAVQVGTGGSVTYTSTSATPVNDKFTYKVITV
jgi:hypothetical protein